MDKVKFANLEYAEKMDCLARKYIFYATREVNKNLNKALFRCLGNKEKVRNNFAIMKNLFLCGSLDISNPCYSTEHGYENNTFSIDGAFFNYMYRSSILEEIGNTNKTLTENKLKEIFKTSYSTVKSCFYQEFYKWRKNAWMPVYPSSVVEENAKEASFSKRPLSEISGAGKKQIVNNKKDILRYIKKELIEYLEPSHYADFENGTNFEDELKKNITNLASFQIDKENIDEFTAFEDGTEIFDDETGTNVPKRYPSNYYSENGRLINDGGEEISVENGYSEADVNEINREI